MSKHTTNLTIKNFLIVQDRLFESDFDKFIIEDGGAE